MVSKIRGVRIISKVDVKDDNIVKGAHLEGLRVVGSPSVFSSIYFQEFIEYLDILEVQF